MNWPLSRQFLLCASELAASRTAAAYRRVCRCARPDRAVRHLSTSARRTTQDDAVTGEEGAWAVRSAAVSARIRELKQANAFAYPRIQERAGHTSIPAFRQKYDKVTPDAPGQEEVVLCGRLQSVRRASSKLVFLDLTGEFERVQGLCNFRRLELSGATLVRFKEMSKLLQRGDLVSVTGRAIRTPAGELTLEATQLPDLLSPGLVPLPTRLADEETRIQNRHVDLLVNRGAADVLRLRSHVMRNLRDFLHARDFLEFQTPILAERAGGAAARPFATTSTEFRSRELALRVAPELWLKRLVVGGVDRVFEIGPAFRNEGVDLTHNPEFTMCEFYCAYASLPRLVRLTEAFLHGLALSCHDLISTRLASLPAVDPARFAGPYEQLEFVPTLESALGFTLPDLAAPSALEDLRALLREHHISVDGASAADTDDTVVTLPKLLDRLAGLYLEPRATAAGPPVFITHHPVCMSPLAKSFACPATGQLVSARAEVFVGGRELANMYEEENDPAAQRRKFIEQALRRDPEEMAVTAREDDHDTSVAIDEGYVQALESGLPPTGGWGCGVERLVMLFSGTPRISDCLSFGSLRNVVGLSAGARKRGRQRRRQQGEDEEGRTQV